MEKGNKKFCSKCEYELVLKDYGIPSMEDCFAPVAGSPLSKNKNLGTCEQRYYCYKCNKFCD